MGRQFRYYCMPDDLAQIQSRALVPSGGQLVVAEKSGEAEVLTVVEKFDLPLDAMGKETLFLLLAPPSEMSRIEYQGNYIDTSNSHLIELGRCYISNGYISPARFWYEPRTFERGQFFEKPANFVSWADRVFREAKKVLLRREYLFGTRPWKEWFGPAAWDSVTAQKLRPKLN